MTVNTNLSGIVYNSTSYGKFVVDKPATQKIHQEFYLPADFVRGGDVIPQLSGFQVLCSIEDGFAAAAAIYYEIDWYGPGGWTQLVSGSEQGAHVDGPKVWFDIYLDKPLQITEEMLSAKFRFSVDAQSSTDPLRKVPVTFNRQTGQYTIESRGITFALPYVYLYPGIVYNFTSTELGTGTLFWDIDSNQIYYSSQHGVTNYWYWYGNWNAYYLDGTDQVYTQDANQNVQLHFRLLAGVADTGQDIIGNEQRQVVTVKDTNSLDPFVEKGPNDYWMSKPNPSKFAVECLYFDMREQSKAQVIDKVSIDPITNGIYFNVYYSNDGPEPGHDDKSWEQKLWNRVPRTYHLDKKDTFVFPEPVTAKYMCLEFTHLKPESYNPGEISFPVTYKKHPKWVLDYFLSRLETDSTADAFVASRINISFDALDLAYNYFLDDLKQEPDQPVKLTPDVNTNGLSQFLTNRQDASDLIDATTLQQIKFAFSRYKEHPTQGGPLDYIYTQYGPGGGNNYAVEVATPTTPVSSDVSSLSREALIVEQNFPVMFFYVPCRHTYREVSADLTYNRAYFAGIKEVAFLRETYASKYDGGLYIENIGDETNVERNDFFTTETFSWITHPE